MRIWLSRNGGTSLRDQLTTQLMLGVMSEELKAGEKLPSVREMARRCHIHANTASAAYRDRKQEDGLISEKAVVFTCAICKAHD